MGFPGGASGKEPACQCRRHKRHWFGPRVGKIPLEEGIAIHSSILAWRSPWTKEPGGQQSIGSKRVRHDWSNLATTHAQGCSWATMVGLSSLGYKFSSVQLLSRVQLCNPMDCSMPGLPVHHQLREFTQTHVHWVGDTIQPSHPLSSPSP